MTERNAEIEALQREIDTLRRRLRKIKPRRVRTGPRRTTMIVITLIFPVAVLWLAWPHIVNWMDEVEHALGLR